MVVSQLARSLYTPLAILSIVATSAGLFPGNAKIWGKPRRRWILAAFVGCLIEALLIYALLVFPNHAAQVPRAQQWFRGLWLLVSGGFLLNANTVFWLAHSIHEKTFWQRFFKGVFIGAIAAMTWAGLYMALYYYRFATPGPALPPHLPLA